MTPLIIRATGRSGTTLLMSILASHREIVAHQQYPLEFKLYTSSVSPPESREPNLRMLRRRAYRFPDSEALLYELLDAGEPLGFEQILKVYSAIAATANKRPLYFAEKGTLMLRRAHALRLCPQCRFVFLIRDPRDVFLSVRSFDAKRGSFGFLAKEGDTDEIVISKYKSVYQGLINDFDPADSFLVRYEELIVDASRTLAQLFEWLGVASDAKSVANARGGADTLDRGLHATSLRPEASVGRWRRELSVRQSQLFLRYFERIIPKLGYQLHL